MAAWPFKRGTSRRNYWIVYQRIDCGDVWHETNHDWNISYTLWFHLHLFLRSKHTDTAGRLASHGNTLGRLSDVDDLACC